MMSMMLIFTTHMMQDSGFRYKVSINKGLGVVHGSDADSVLDVCYNTETYKKIHKYIYFPQ